jgi:hypothetical protein
MDSMDDMRPVSPSPVDSEPTEHAAQAPQFPRTDFPDAGRVHGYAKTFIDRLNDDKYATHRTQNRYYPFADQEEWELGSFLLGSGMSMQKVNEFLRLKLVISIFTLFFASFTNFHPD